jgi:2-oxoglutarate dehydrogenase E2 component (dihydrolipoamide succinyltransferase)
VVRWFKKEGSRVKQGEPVVELETDKVNYELDSPAGGVLLKIVAAVDVEVPVGDPRGCIGQLGETARKWSIRVRWRHSISIPFSSR